MLLARKVASMVTAASTAEIGIAAYVAGIGTATLLFQVISWRRNWKTRVEVDLKRSLVIPPGEDPKSIIQLTVTNQSAHGVRVTSVGLTPIRPGGKHIWFQDTTDSDDVSAFEIGSRDSLDLEVQPHLLTSPDPQRKTRAIVKTADKRDFKSRKVRLADLLPDQNGPGE